MSKCCLLLFDLKANSVNWVRYHRFIRWLNILWKYCLCRYYLNYFMASSFFKLCHFLQFDSEKHFYLLNSNSLFNLRIGLPACCILMTFQCQTQAKEMTLLFRHLLTLLLIFTWLVLSDQTCLLNSLILFKTYLLDFSFSSNFFCRCIGLGYL